MNNLKAYTKSQLRACQLKQLRILQEVDAVCRRHNIDYWIDFGTLLGAVRHGGFIPWDDDIDLGMTTEALRRFSEIAPSELPDWLTFQSPMAEKTKEPIAKIRDNNSFYVENSDDFSADYAKGVFIDIFPYEAYPDCPRSFVRSITRGICRSYSILHRRHYYSLRSFAEFFWFGGKYILYSSLWRLACLFKSKKSFIGNIPINNGYGVMHRNSDIYPLGTVKFEGKTFPAPANIDSYLRNIYKDYTAIPPEDKRQVHAIFIQAELERV